MSDNRLQPPCAPSVSSTDGAYWIMRIYKYRLFRQWIHFLETGESTDCKLFLPHEGSNRVYQVTGNSVIPISAFGAVHLISANGTASLRFGSLWTRAAGEEYRSACYLG